MTLRVVGAGLGRTGTRSLKTALEQLLGAPCYHMLEVFEHPEHVPAWHDAARGTMPDWRALLRGYAAAVDWPAAAYWRELAGGFPDALVLLSVRDPERWWESANETIFAVIRNALSSDASDTGWTEMVREMFASRFTPALEDRDTCIAAYLRHNQAVRDAVPASRLVEWTAADGWAPLCAALGVPEPREPFPRTNTREEWRSRSS